MDLRFVHSLLSWASVVASVVTAGLWVAATQAKELSVGTSGWGALVGGMVVVEGPHGERLDLVGTMRKQSSWNARAAWASAVAALLLALSTMTQ